MWLFFQQKLESFKIIFSQSELIKSAPFCNHCSSSIFKKGEKIPLFSNKIYSSHAAREHSIKKLKLLLNSWSINIWIEVCSCVREKSKYLYFWAGNEIRHNLVICGQLRRILTPFNPPPPSRPPQPATTPPKYTKARTYLNSAIVGLGGDFEWKSWKEVRTLSEWP